MPDRAMPVHRQTVDPGQWRAAVAEVLTGGPVWFEVLTATERPVVAEGHAPVEVILRVRRLAAADASGAAGAAYQLHTTVGPDRTLDSVTGLLRGAAWCEREVAEMMGVRFTGFDDGTGLGLRRLLLPETFEGEPLRKSAELAARGVVPWPGLKEPGEARPAAGRRRTQAPGVPAWGVDGG